MEAKTELQKNAIANARRKELESYQRALDIEWLNSRMDDGRMGRCLALIQREAEMEKDFQERTDHAAIVNARADREAKLAMEVAKVRREEMCALLRRHYLRERDPSLQELIKKLTAGYVCRDLKQQILLNEYKRLQEKVEENYANRILLKALYTDKEAMDREEMEKIQRNTQYCKELQQQVVNKQQQKQCQYEDTLIEKKMLEEVMRTIADEDKRELEKKQRETEELRHEMVTSSQARAAWKEKQKQMIVIEDRQIEKQRQLAADRSSAVVEERERKMRAKEELNDKIACRMMSDEAACLERENIIKLLQEQEYLEKHAQDDIAEMENLERVKKEMRENLTNQMESKKQEAHKQRELDAEFRKETEERMAVNDQNEHEKAMKIKEKGRQYGIDLRQQIEDNARRREKEKKEEEAREQAVWDYDENWRSEVRLEHDRIVSAHGAHVLESHSDLPFPKDAASDPPL